MSRLRDLRRLNRAPAARPPGPSPALENASRASSENFFAIARKICQSLFDSQHGGTAADSGWMKLCMSVVFRSAFSYHVAAGSTMSEYSADVSMRKFRSTTRSIFPWGAFSCHIDFVNASLLPCPRRWRWCACPGSASRKNSWPLALAISALPRQMNHTRGQFSGASGSSTENFSLRCFSCSYGIVHNGFVVLGSGGFCFLHQLRTGSV